MVHIRTECAEKLTEFEIEDFQSVLIMEAEIKTSKSFCARAMMVGELGDALQKAS